MSKHNPLALVVSPVWKNGRFLRLWTAQTISLLGDQLYLLALPWLVYNITQSGSQMALVFAYEMLPYLVFSLVGGVLSDKWNRKHMLVYGNIFAMIPLLVIYFLYESGHLAMWHIYAGSFLLSCIVSLILPAFESAIPSIVDNDDLVQANSLSEVTNSLTTLLGPFLSGLIISLIGAELSVLINGLSFLLAGLIYVFLRFEAVVSEKERTTLHSVLFAFKEGFLYVAGHRVIRVGVMLSTLTNITVGAYTAILIYHMRHTMGLSSEATGLVMTLSSVTSLLASAVVAPNLNGKLPKGLLMILSLALTGIGLACVGLSGNLIALIVAQGVYMGGVTLFTINWRTLRQEVTPKNMIGRVSGVCRGIAYAGASLGGFLGGITLARFNHTHLLAVEGMIIVLVALVAFKSPLRQKPSASLTTEQTVAK